MTDKLERSRHEAFVCEFSFLNSRYYKRDEPVMESSHLYPCDLQYLWNTLASFGP